MGKKFFKSELTKGAITLFITLNLFNFLNFLFHFIMGRMLGPSDYGILAVLMSLIYIYNVPVEALQSIISRYTSTFNLKKEDGKIKYLIIKTLKKGFKIALILFIGATFLSIILSKFLDINFWLIFLTNIFIFFSFSIPVLRGILQGKKRFKTLGASFIIESVPKLIITILLVIIGFKVFGAILGVLLGTFLGLLSLIYFNKDILVQKEEKISLDDAYSKSIPYFITMLIIFFVFSLDILLAKRFFSEEIAGQYAVLSMMGKMIFLGTIAISKAMFPLTSEKYDSNKNSWNLFKKAFLITGIICLISVFACAIIPKFIIWVFYGSQYIKMAPYLVYSALAFSFLSLSNLSLIYGLSINRLKKTYFLFIFILIEIILLLMFHENILEFILAFMIGNIIMFAGSLFAIKK